LPRSTRTCPGASCSAALRALGRSLAAETNLVRAAAPPALYAALVRTADDAAADLRAAGVSATLLHSVQVETAPEMQARCVTRHAQLLDSVAARGLIQLVYADSTRRPSRSRSRWTCRGSCASD
jgi:hypothetical protein